MTATVTIGVVAVGPPTWPFVGSIVKLEKPGAWRWLREGPLAVDVGRNRLVKRFLAAGDEWLLMVDADADLHPQTLRRLLSWGQPLVGALCFSRYGPCFPTVYRGQPANSTRGGFLVQLDEVRDFLRAHPALITSEPMVLEEQDGSHLVEVDRTGCHCVLIHRDVLASVPAPWFQAREDYHEGAGEDFYFFAKAAEAGYRAYVDLGCMAGHAYGERSLAGQDFLVWDYASDYGAA